MANKMYYDQLFKYNRFSVKKHTIQRTDPWRCIKSDPPKIGESVIVLKNDDTISMRIYTKYTWMTGVKKWLPLSFLPTYIYNNKS